MGETVIDIDPSLRIQVSGIVCLQRYHSHSNDYLEICRCYKAKYEIPSVKEDPLQWILVKLLLKQLVTMEVIQWTSLWNTFKVEFENENNMLGGSLGEKAAEDLRTKE
ncbi:26S proteasome non-ATPase regulatory subunit 12-like protein B [Forsythia ovata]|uniref:26S proteasome non-ATPase regulatory subunit 12-like protein B n=1 Tax=Forsythia ovata TaxID=205694 RepID=A0ABD1XD98_9LAMI